MTQLKVQNFYSTTLTQSIAASGDVDFTVAVAPTETKGFIVISSENSVLREIMFYHNVVGSRVYVKGDNRLSPKAHSTTETVKINDVAEIFNFFSDNLSQCFYVQKNGGLSVTVWGGYVYYNGAMVTVADTTLTLTNNTTNYIKYDYATNVISVDTTNSGNIKATVTTLSSVVTGVTYKNSKESYIDFTVAITGALPSQTGNAGKALYTDGTNVYWGSINASTTVKGLVELSTSDEVQQLASVGGTGAALSVDPSQVGSLYSKGDGSDGDVTISVNTALTRDMYYRNLTVNTGIVLDPAGYAIFCSQTLTLSGTAKIRRNGNNGTAGVTVTPGVAGAALATGTCGVNLAGKDGQAGSTSPGVNGIAATSVSPSYATTATNGALGGIGGTGSGGGSAGGTAGAVGTATQGIFYNTKYNLSQLLAQLLFPGRAPYNTSIYGGLPSGSGAGSGGGNGGGTSGGAGGGGGGNGGIIFISTNTVAGTGTIESIGGNGGAGGNSTGASTGGGGGGAGGSGGVVILIYKNGTPWTITLTGGTGGTGGTGTFQAGGNGAAGTVGQSILINV